MNQPTPSTTPAPFPIQKISVDDLVQLCAVDNNLFSKSFFPKTARQDPAPFHEDVWNILEDPAYRFVNLVCFRDSAKTSLLRMFTGKRIGYNTSRTILYIGASEGHAGRSIRWLRNQIEAKRGASGAMKRSFYAETFDLKSGVKWTDVECEIFHGVDAAPIWILGAGITGNIRGINFDDFRPDLIVCDDILTDENGATKEQRDKIVELVMGALKNSLAPASESPNAKLVMLNTPQAIGDVVHEAEKDPEFYSVRYPCWTANTIGLDVSQQVSSWEARYPTPVRRQEKLAAIAANKLSTFSREKEVRIVSKETAIFRSDWLEFYSGSPPPGGQTVIFIDPTPAPKKRAVERTIRKLDYEVVGAMRRVKGNFYLLDYEALQGGTPDWTIAKFFEMRYKWRPYKAVVESAAYQATLRWILENEMKRRGQWLTVEDFDDIRAKPVRIQTAIHGVASNHRLYVKRSHTSFIEQFEKYPAVEFDDILDGVAMGIIGLTNAYIDLDEGDYHEIDNSMIPKVQQRRVCP